MIVPITAKIAGVMFLWHWVGMYLLRNIENNPHLSARQRAQRDSIRGLMLIVRTLAALLAAVTIILL